MQQTIQANVTNHYRRNRDAYDKIRTKLSRVRKKFEKSGRSGKITMLQKAHWFAVLSIQASVDKHEEAFEKIAADYDSGRPITWNMRSHAKSLNYNNQKCDWIEYGIDHGNVFDTVAGMLSNNQVDDAHKYLIDNMKGVSSTKAAFMLAMLGYTEKMCIDTNIQQICEIPQSKTVVVSRYEEDCQQVKDTFKSLSDMVEPFMLQWILFDYQRGNISTHDVWFDTILR